MSREQGSNYSSTVIRYVGNVPTNATSSSRKLLQNQGVTVYYNLQQVPNHFPVSETCDSRALCCRVRLSSLRELRAAWLCSSFVTRKCQLNVDISSPVNHISHSNGLCMAGLGLVGAAGRAEGSEHAVQPAECAQPER